MLALLIPLLLGLREGDHWTSERTLQFIQLADKIDIRDVDRLTYSVVRAEAEVTSIQLEVVPGPKSQSKATRKLTIFRPGGVLGSQEDTSDLNLARINRMEWTALEPRKGISWSRSWPAASTLVEAKVLVRPTARTVDDTTLLVTYKEGDKTKCVATIKVLNEVPVIEDLALTVNNAEVPGSAKPGSMIVSEKLKEVHIADR